MSEHFQGFSKGTFDFLNDLKANNSKLWFEENRDRYDTHWKAPALALIDELAPEMGNLDPPLKAEARINGSLRRINRDVRFSRDKSPYDPRLHLIFWSGSHPNRSPAFHFVLEANGVGFGAGVFGLPTGVLNQYRSRILQTDQRNALLKAIQQCQLAGAQFTDPELKRLPRGYATEEEWEHLLRRKSFVARTMSLLPLKDWIDAADTVSRISEIAAAHSPLIRWLAQNSK